MERLQFIIALSTILWTIIWGVRYLNKENKQDRIKYIKLLLIILMDTKPHLTVEIFTLYDEYKALWGNGYIENEFNKRKQKYYDNAN
jgi:c-di-AMP phosphodiesterase-like protein